MRRAKKPKKPPATELSAEMAALLEKYAGEGTSSAYEDKLYPTLLTPDFASSFWFAAFESADREDDWRPLCELLEYDFPAPPPVRPHLLDMLRRHRPRDCEPLHALLTHEDQKVRRLAAELLLRQPKRALNHAGRPQPTKSRPSYEVLTEEEHRLLTASVEVRKLRRGGMSVGAALEEVAGSRRLSVSVLRKVYEGRHGSLSKKLRQFPSLKNP